MASSCKQGSMAAGKLSPGQSVCLSIILFLLETGREGESLSEFYSCFGPSIAASQQVHLSRSCCADCGHTQPSRYCTFLVASTPTHCLCWSFLSEIFLRLQFNSVISGRDIGVTGCNFGSWRCSSSGKILEVKPYLIN